MSLTSYRAAPPRDKSVRAFFEKAETAETAPQGRASVQRLPEKATLGPKDHEVAGGMYQRLPALERAGGSLLRIL